MSGPFPGVRPGGAAPRYGVALRRVDALLLVRFRFSIQLVRARGTCGAPTPGLEERRRTSATIVIAFTVRSSRCLESSRTQTKLHPRRTPARATATEIVADAHGRFCCAHDGASVQGVVRVTIERPLRISFVGCSRAIACLRTLGLSMPATRVRVDVGTSGVKAALLRIAHARVFRRRTAYDRKTGGGRPGRDRRAMAKLPSVLRNQREALASSVAVTAQCHVVAVYEEGEPFTLLAGLD